MGVRFPSVATTVPVGVLASNGAESAIFTTPPISIPFPNTQIIIIWEFVGNTGNGTTSINARIRRGAGLTGVFIDQNAGFAVTPNTQSRLNGCYVDTPGDIAGLQYTLTFSGGATTGVGTSLDGCMIAFCL